MLTGELSTPVTLKGDIYRGVGGTRNYEDLENLPSINGDELIGDISIWQPNNFSTDEQDTGLKWVNGKSLYQKTYLFGDIQGGSAALPLGLTGIENIMIAPSYFKSGDNYITFPYVHPDATNIVGGFFSDNNTVLQIRVGTSMSGHVSDLTITILYTKIND